MEAQAQEQGEQHQCTWRFKTLGHCEHISPSLTVSGRGGRLLMPHTSQGHKAKRPSKTTCEPLISARLNPASDTRKHTRTNAHSNSTSNSTATATAAAAVTVRLRLCVAQRLLAAFGPGGRVVFGRALGAVTSACTAIAFSFGTATCRLRPC